MNPYPEQVAEYVAQIGLVEVKGYKAYCTACDWYSVEYGDIPGAKRSGEHHLRERHSDGPVGSTAEEASARRAARSPEYRVRRAERDAELNDRS